MTAEGIREELYSQGTSLVSEEQTFYTLGKTSDLAAAMEVNEF